MRPGCQHWVYVCNNSQTHWRRAAPERSVPPGTSTWVRRGASVTRGRWSGTELPRSENTTGTAGQQRYKPLKCSQQQPTHQSAQGQQPHKGTGGQQLEEKPPSHSFKKDKESRYPSPTHLQAHHIDQRLVSDVDLTQDLCDRHSGNQQVERHKQREDWGQPARGDRIKSGTTVRRPLE